MLVDSVLLIPRKRRGCDVNCWCRESGADVTT